MNPTKHRARFHTDRVVEVRRARFEREQGSTYRIKASNHDEWIAKRLSHGRLSTMDPWDCGGSCTMCHYEKRAPGRRSREKRSWQREEW